jgi:hypothetical protein
MELLRFSSLDNLPFEVRIPDYGSTETIYTQRVTDLADLSVTETGFTAEPGETLVRFLDGRYDTEYQVTITGAEGQVIHDETYEVVRPYSDPRNKGETASDVANYTKNEELARAIIDSIVWGGFYYRKKTIETVGLGADYLPLWVDAKKIVAVYENNVLVQDRQYEITKDKTSVQELYSGIYNRDEQAKNIIPAAMSDSIDNVYGYRGFPKGFDYKIVVESGYTSVPSDIVRATELLIDDISCGKLDYYKRYISDYNTDQFKIKFDGRVFEGTGNILVDKILSKYVKSIARPGVL